MASIYKRGDTWWISYRVAGRTVSHSLETQNARIAQELKVQYEAKKTNGLIPKPSVTPIGPFLQALCEFWRQHRKAKGAETDIGRLRGVFGPCCPALEFRRHTPQKFRRAAQNGRHLPCRKLEDLSTDSINQYLHDRVLAEKITGKTANKIRGVLSSMFAYARRFHGYVCPDPAHKNSVEGTERFKEIDHPIIWLKTLEIEQQLMALDDQPLIRAMVATLIYAGLRRSEMLWLTTEDVDLQRLMIRVQAKVVGNERWEPKTKKNRTVPISTKLLAELTAYLSLQKGKWFFPMPEDGRWDPDYFSECLREINAAKGLLWSCIEFRHTFGSHLAQKGVSLYKISELMGNSPEICRKHYAALVPQEMHDEVEF